jgi:hypothetical protein
MPENFREIAIDVSLWYNRSWGTMPGGVAATPLSVRVYVNPPNLIKKPPSGIDTE